MSKQSTWRDKRITLEPKEVYKYTFLDTKPNHAYITNNSASAIYVSASANVSALTFDTIVPPFGSKLFARMEGMINLYLYTDSIEPIVALVSSFEGEFNPSSLSQTQEIVSTDTSGLLGVVDVKTIFNPLPAGQNHVGLVTVLEGMTSVDSAPTVEQRLDDLKSLVDSIKNEVTNISINSDEIVTNTANSGGGGTVVLTTNLNAYVYRNTLPVSAQFMRTNFQDFSKIDLVVSNTLDQPVRFVPFSNSSTILEDGTVANLSVDDGDTNYSYLIPAGSKNLYISQLELKSNGVKAEKSLEKNLLEYRLANDLTLTIKSSIAPVTGDFTVRALGWK